MTSGAALDDQSVIKSSEGDGCQNRNERSFTAEESGQKKCILNNKKRQAGMMSSSSSSSMRVKVIRTSVQRSLSPIHTTHHHSSPVWLNRIKKVNPTVLGIQEVANHLLRTKSRRPASRDATHSILALPTECTYEACSLVSWTKDENSSDDDKALREEQLDRLKAISSSNCVNIYLQHHNIQLMDQILKFPKKAYATKQNPNVCCAFNESRLLFQKLADQFWPGPVHIYLPPQSFAPDGLIQMNFSKRSFIGFRCPSHPLAVKVLKQVNQQAGADVVLVGAPIMRGGETLLSARDVASKLLQNPTMLHSDSVIEILHGEERREIFTVPTCQFKDEWLECWIVPDKRTIILRGKSKRDVIPQLREVLRSTTGKNRVICSILQYWKVADHREKCTPEHPEQTLACDP